MLTAGAFEAKTHFSKFLNKVIHGQSVMITLHGKTVAMLVPVKESATQSLSDAAEAVEAIRKLRKGIRLGKDLSIKRLIAQGRR